MKLPVSGAGIDERNCIRLIRYAIDRGVNYLGIDYPYIPERLKNIRKIIGSALEGGYRRKVRLSITLPAMLIKSPSDFDSYLNRQLELLRIDRTDHFLLGGMDRQTWPRLRELGIIRSIEQAMASQRIGLPGFSFHDDFQTLKEVVTGYNWAFCSFPYNYMEVDRLPGAFGLKYAADKGLGVVITEPLKRGRLIKNPPQFKPLKCTPCRACLPCPQDIDIPRIFELYNDGLMYDDAETARAILDFEQHRIEDCDGCGVCARRCGKGIDIPEILKTVQRM